MASDRHHSLDLVRGYLDGPVPGALAISGNPAVELVIDPTTGTIGFSSLAGGEEPDLRAYRTIDYSVVLNGEQAKSELTVCVPAGALEEAYSWLCAVIDRIQTDGMHPGDAVGASLGALDVLFATTHVLSVERQVGLFGELAFLSSLIDHLGPVAALGAWFGSDAEEHDFRLVGRDVEVKTTTSEKRRHWISTKTQLVPLGGRPLGILSVQLTAVPGKVGWSLPELVAFTADRLDGPSQRNNFVDGLQNAGYDVAHELRYDRRWALRTRPLMYPVDEHFPAIGPGDIAEIVDEPVRVIDFKYQLDLDGLPHQEIGFEIDLPSQDSP